MSWFQNPTHADIPVYQVEEIVTGIIKTCHRNQLLPLFQCEDFVKPTKLRHVDTESVPGDACRHDLTNGNCNVDLPMDKPMSDTETKDSTSEVVVAHHLLTDIDSDGSNTENQVSPDVVPESPTCAEYSGDTEIDSQELSGIPPDGIPPDSDSFSNDSTPPESDGYMTRSGRSSKPPDRFTPSKALRYNIFGY